MADVKINLLAKLKRLSYKELMFTGITAQKDRDGKMIAILQLEEPIQLVRGTQEVEWNGRMQAITAKDVLEIKVHEEDMNDDFHFSEETDTGSYKGSDLTLDVAKNGTVWMKKTTFAAGAGNFRQEARKTRLGKLFGEAEAKPFATPTVNSKPTPVDVTPAVGAGNKPK